MLLLVQCSRLEEEVAGHKCGRPCEEYTETVEAEKVRRTVWLPLVQNSRPEVLTMACWTFARTGHCHFANCRFRHDHVPDARPVDEFRPPRRPENQLFRNCFAWLEQRRGYSKEGCTKPRCHRDHRVVDMSGAAPLLDTKLTRDDHVVYLPGENPCLPEGQVPKRTTVRIFWHTGGICLGGVPLRAMGLKRSACIFVGSESGYDFEDPEGRGHRGRQEDPWSKEFYTNAHCGGCGLIQAAFLRSSIDAKHGALNLDDPARFVGQVLRGSTIRHLAIAILEAIGLAHQDAVNSFRAGGMPEGLIEVICDKGHHRSEFAAEMGALICKMLNFTVAVRRHHLRIIRGFREKADCRCWTGHCHFPELTPQ